MGQVALGKSALYENMQQDKKNIKIKDNAHRGVFTILECFCDNFK